MAKRSCHDITELCLQCQPPAARQWGEWKGRYYLPLRCCGKKLSLNSLIYQSQWLTCSSEPVKISLIAVSELMDGDWLILLTKCALYQDTTLFKIPLRCKHIMANLKAFSYNMNYSTSFLIIALISTVKSRSDYRFCSMPLKCV